MPLKIFRPLTPSLRFTELNRPEGIVDKRPERGLTEHKHKTGGRNCYGRLTSRRRGGGHKQLYRIIDFKRAKLDVPAPRCRRSNTIPTAPRSSPSSPTPTARRTTSSRPRASRSATR